jgi:superfamily I DNA/RNA helicase/RecB family exonuclease
MAELTREQRVAVEHSGSPLIVLAGPGTGKTRVIVHRVAHAIQSRGVDPSSVVAVTFTVKAAAEIRARLAKLIGASAERVQASTFHGLGLSILRRFPAELAAIEPGLRAGRARGVRGGGARSMKLIDSSQERRLFRQVILDHLLFEDIRASGIDDIIEHARAFRAALGSMGMSPAQSRGFLDRAEHALASGLTIDGRPLDNLGRSAEAERILRTRELTRAIDLFSTRASQLGLISYDDLITLPTRLLTGRHSGEGGAVAAIVRDSARFWVVDEYQDVNPAQLALLRGCVPPGGSGQELCVVGDDDQAIYGFRGADDRAFARFAKLWPAARVVELSRNYRSAEAIVRLSRSIISRAGSRFRPEKRLEHDPDRDLEIRASGPGPSVTAIRHASSDDPDALLAAWLLADAASDTQREWSNYAVLCRSRPVAEAVALALEIESIPVRLLIKTGGLDEGVRRLREMIRLFADPSADQSALHLLLRPPLSIDPRELHALRLRERHAASDDAPPGFLAWARDHAMDVPAVRTLLAWIDELHAFNAEHSAAESLDRLIALMDVVHADLLPGRARAARLRSVIRFRQGVHGRLDRLDAPADLVALDRYLRDLDESELDAGAADDLDGLDDLDDLDELDELGKPNIADDALNVDLTGDESALAVGEPPARRTGNAVRIMTAHGSKGLEFDTVLLPRVFPPNGFPQTAAPPDRVALGLPTGFGPLEGGQDSGRDALERRLDEERRLFYVACTRAERRVVMICKATKTRSSSTHFVDELQDEPLDPLLGPIVTVRASSDVYRDAAERGVGSARAAWRSLPGTAAPTPARGSSDDRRALLERARGLVRVLAASALDRAELVGSDDPVALAAAESRLAGLARCAAALDHYARAGSLPGHVSAAQLIDIDAPLGQELRLLLSALLSHPAPADAGREPGLPVRADDLMHADPVSSPGEAIALDAARIAARARSRNSFSLSSLSAYDRCPRCYLAGELNLLSDASDPVRLVGTIAHHVLEQHTALLRTAESDGHAPPRNAGIPDAGERELRASWPAGRALDRETVQRLRAQLQIAARMFDEDAQEPVTILELEHKASLSLGDVVITARIDRIDRYESDQRAGEFRIVDYKTGRSRSGLREPAADDLQLGVYAMCLAELYGDAVEGDGQYWLLSTGERGIRRFRDMKPEKVRQRLLSAIAGIRAGAFARSAGGFAHDCDVLKGLGFE